MENVMMDIMEILARAGGSGVFLVLAVFAMLYFFINRPGGIFVREMGGTRE